MDIVRTQPYPDFKRYAAQMMALLTIAKARVSLKLYLNQNKHAEELMRMGADITLEGRTAIVKGVNELTGTTVHAKDLRGGAALIMAGLVAQGSTIVEGTKHIERGYEEIDKDLQLLGASIRKID